MQDDQNNLKIDVIIWYFTAVLIGIISAINLLIVVCYKNKKTHEDILTIEKKCIDVITMFYLGLFVLMGVNNSNESSDIIESCFLNVYIIAHFTFQTSILIEDHNTKIDPSYLLKSFIKKGYSYFYELSFLIFLSLFFVFKWVDRSNNDIRLQYLFSDNVFTAGIILFLTLIIILTLKKQWSILHEIKDTKFYTKRRFILDFINLLLSLLFVIFYILLVIISKSIKTPEDKNQHYFNILRFYTYFFLFVMLIYEISFLIKFYYSDFYFYTLSNTCIKVFFKCFKSNSYKRPLIYSEIYSTTVNKNSSAIHFNDKLNLAIDEVILTNFDFILNCITGSLFKVFGETHQSMNNDKMVLISDKDESDTSKLKSGLVDKPTSVTSFHFKRQDFINDERLSTMFKDSGSRLEVSLK